MRAILLAAGHGIRLRPLTDKIPKCLVPINGVPLLGIWLEKLISAGVDDILINTHYLAEMVDDFVSKCHYKDQIKLVHEPILLGTAGTLIANLEFLQSGDGLLIHADNYCCADFTEFKNRHFLRPNGCVMTMMTFRTDNPTNCGIVKVNSAGVVIEFHEKVENPPGDLANGAVFIISSEMINKLDKDFRNAKDISNDIIGKFVGKIYSYETLDLFLDIGTPSSYEKANFLAANKRINQSVNLK